jgi:hypothetical protein
MKKYTGFLAILLLASCSKDSDSVGNSTTPPTSARLLLPQNNSICYESGGIIGNLADVSFSWSEGQNVTSYDLIITNMNNAQMETKKVSGEKTTVSLLRGNSYRWQLVSKSLTSKEIAQSETWRFYLPNDGQSTFAPLPATVIQPKPGISFSKGTTQVTLEWKGQDQDSPSLSYEIFLSKEADKVLNRTVSPLKTTDSSIKFNVEPNSIYYWSIKTSDGRLASYTILYSFKVN